MVGLKEFVVAVYKKWPVINTIRSVIHLGSFISQYLLFDFAPVERQEKKNSFDRKHEIICCMSRNDVLPSEHCGKEAHPRYFKKRSVGLENVMFLKCYFQA